jgi:protein-glutamine gamma-glutamyltransferase
MRTPPFLLGATLIFWGWQTGFLIPGILMGLALESARWTKARWEFSDEDFNRVWTFCSLLLIAAGVFAFSDNQGPSDFLALFQSPNYFRQRNAGMASARTAAALIRWLPMIFFLFVGAQIYSARDGIPLHSISLILRRRRKNARRLGQPLPGSPSLNLAYPYFALTLFAASIHTGEDSRFFLGLSILMAWVLVTQRSRRFNFAVWAAAVLVAAGLGYAGQRGLGLLQQYIGSFNPRWLMGSGHRGFDPTQSRTSLGQIGRSQASGKIVIRLESKAGPLPPLLLREASYRGYKGQIWFAGKAEKDFEKVAQTNDTSWLLLPEKTNSASLNIECYVPGGAALLPLPAGSWLLENLPAFLPLQKSSLGAVYEQGPGFVSFDAYYGPGASIDSAPESSDQAEPPSAELSALEKVIAELNLAKGATLRQAQQALQNLFQSKFTYGFWQEADRVVNPAETPLNQFLLHTRRGHCEFFATATVLLLRQLGFPARYAVGYAVHEASGHKYVVRLRDAHAWCLVWDHQTKTWQDFDTTPASWVAIETARASPLQALSDGWSWLGFQFSRFRWGQTHLRQYLLWVLVPTLALLLYQILFRRRRQRLAHGQEARGPASAWPGLDSEFYQLEKLLARRGIARSAGEPLSAWLWRATDESIQAELREPLQQLLQLHYRYRFDPHGLNESDRAALRRQVNVCLARLQTQ